MNGRLPYPTLMLVTDRTRSVTPLALAVPAAVSGGVDLVQLREPDLPESEIRQLAIELIAAIGRDRLLINGRPELAADIATGLHLREDQPAPTRDSGKTVTTLLGRSVHGSAGTALRDGNLDYLLAGNVYRTRSHPDRRARGLRWLRSQVQRSDLPVLAIGGITAANAVGVMAAGCHGVAVIDAILADHRPGQAARALRTALDDAARSSHADRDAGKDDDEGATHL